MLRKVRILSFLFALGVSLLVRTAAAQEYFAHSSPVDGALASFDMPIAGVPPMASADEGGWKFSGDLLIVRPTTGDTYFVIDSPLGATQPIGSRINNDPLFNTAFRVGAAYEFANSPAQFQVTWTRLDTDNSKLVTGTDLWATAGSSDIAGAFQTYNGTAAADLAIKHNRVDTMFTAPLCIPCIDLALQFGFEYADVRVQEGYFYENSVSTATGSVLFDSTAKGIGPEFGFIVGYDLLSGCNGDGRLSFTMNSTASLLLASAKTSSLQTVNNAVMVNVFDDTTSRIIPALHIGVGLNYDKVLCGRAVRFSLGYEFNNYFDAIGRSEYPDDVADGFTLASYRDFGLQGLYFSSVVKF
ncbi:hypothetical protein LOC68_04270 [Blastopirellula sp. JC732]|uniref:Major outer membrane protein n=1 Tax=Blastopirellula sediminis TaxID=2894196 RepID=A0A9X1SFC1_9BACT|nr:Lpg1974 family pore-forming outer membrane protein [Blastopirellula sediminis]MCC9609627.1 hypothetical protein [Blastopirellula sediminis]MCC9627597.1 hypothetical protein [Blastopirellula sediminis]